MPLAVVAWIDNMPAPRPKCYLSAVPCKHGHRERYIGNDTCAVCARDSMRKTNAKRKANRAKLGLKRGQKPRNFADRPKICTQCKDEKEPSAYTVNEFGYLLSACNKCRNDARKYRRPRWERTASVI